MEDCGFEAENSWYLDILLAGKQDTKLTISHSPSYSFDLVQKRLQEPVVYLFLNDYPGSRNACLSRGDERCKSDTIYC